MRRTVSSFFAARPQCIPLCSRLVLLVVNVASATCATAQPATLTRDVLLAIAEQSRRTIEDVTVDYTVMKLSPAGPQQREQFKSEHIIWDSRRFYAETATFLAPEYGNFAFLRVVATDGRQMTIYDAHRGMAGILPEEGHRETNARTREFFDLNMLHERPNDGRSSATGSLIGVLSDPRATVRPEQEIVGGVNAYVVDLVSEGGGYGITVWIDPERGALPLRQEYSLPTRGGKYAEYEIIDAEEVSPGLWLGVSGKKRMIPGLFGSDDYVGEELFINVSKSKDGQRYLIDLNTHPDDTVFNALRVAAPGTLVGDHVNGGEYTVDGMEYAALARALQTTVRAHGFTPQELMESVRLDAQRMRDADYVSGATSSEPSIATSKSVTPSREAARSRGGWWLVASIAVASGVGIAGALMARRYVHS